MCRAPALSAIYQGMHSLLNTMVGLFIVAILVAIATKRLNLPYTVGLVIVGICLVFGQFQISLVLTQNVIFYVILPPLIFEAAINIQWKGFRHDAIPILTLAIAGTIIATAMITAIFHYLLDWPLVTSFAFGALIAATDPVTVIATFKENKVRDRLRLLMESESLLNDGVAAIIFSFALALTHTADLGDFSATQISSMLLLTIGGGIAVGIVCAGSAILLAGRTSDYLVESTLSTVLAYASFTIAEHFHCSGILATVTSGLIMGNMGLADARKYDKFITEKGRQFTLALWDYIAFIANSFVFLLIGITVAKISFRALSDQDLILSIIAILISRAATVYPIAMLFSQSRWRISFAFQHILWWGGLRGALGIALALSLPQDLPMRDVVITTTFATVIFSIVVQGLTMPALLKHLKINEL